MTNIDWEPVLAACDQLGWPRPLHVHSTGSTNTDLRGATEDGQVLLADVQTSGRGRLDRHWVSRAGDGLTFSVRRRVPTTIGDWGWIPLLHGVAVAESLHSVAGVRARLKWPNDVVIERGKLGGILAERDGDAAIVGIGVNLRFAEGPPVPEAACLADAGEVPAAGALMAAVLLVADRHWRAWVASGGDAERCGLADRYRTACSTIGQTVRVVGGDRTLVGAAFGVDADGALLVDDGSAVRRVLAGDVTEVRPH